MGRHALVGNILKAYKNPASLLEVVKDYHYYLQLIGQPDYTIIDIINGLSNTDPRIRSLAKDAATHLLTNKVMYQ